MDRGSSKITPDKSSPFQEALFGECRDVLPGFAALDPQPARDLLSHIGDINYRRAGPGDGGFVEVLFVAGAGYLLFARELKRAYLYSFRESDHTLLHLAAQTLMRSAGWVNEAKIARSIEDRGRLEQS